MRRGQNDRRRIAVLPTQSGFRSCIGREVRPGRFELPTF